MPRIILMDEKGVIIECEYLPQSKGETDTQEAEKLASTTCRPRCGYHRDSELRGINILCFHPSSPYLAQLKQQLASATK